MQHHFIIYKGTLEQILLRNTQKLWLKLALQLFSLHLQFQSRFNRSCFWHPPRSYKNTAQTQKPLLIYKPPISEGQIFSTKRWVEAFSPNYWS